MNGYRQIVFAILCGTLLLGCTPVEITPTTPATAAAPIQVTRQTPTATALSPTSTPTATQPLSTATSTPEATATIRPTLTPRPSSTPRPTATPVRYDLPSWLSDPQAIVVMALTRTLSGDESFITFSNLVTGERFDLPALDERSLDLHWYQDETGTYFEQGRYLVSGGPNPTIKQVNIATGELRLLPPLSDNADKAIVAPGGQYAIRITNEPAPQTLIMEGRESGQATVLPDPFNGRYSSFVEVNWSPAGDFLAALRYAFGKRGTPPDMGLVIYRTDGTIFRWYDGFRGNTWLSDNSYRILYSIDIGYGHYQPCILDVLAGTSDCLNEVFTWSVEQQREPGSYQWLPSGQGVSFAAWDFGSNLCIITLATREISCPIDAEILAPAKLDAEAATFIKRYQWSPDGRYLWLIVDPWGPGSDDATSSQIATAAADGSQFQLLGYGHEGLWRPDLNP
jgi:hypothetical protein